MVEPKRMVQVSSTETNSPWAPIPVDIEGGGGGAGPDGIGWTNVEETEGYIFGKDILEATSGDEYFSLTSYGLEGHPNSNLESFWMYGDSVNIGGREYVYPDDGGSFATQEWVIAQIAAALA